MPEDGFWAAVEVAGWPELDPEPTLEKRFFASCCPVIGFRLKGLLAPALLEGGGPAGVVDPNEKRVDGLFAGVELPPEADEAVFWNKLDGPPPKRPDGLLVSELDDSEGLLGVAKLGNEIDAFDCWLVGGCPCPGIELTLAVSPTGFCPKLNGLCAGLLAPSKIFPPPAVLPPNAFAGCAASVTAPKSGLLPVVLGTENGDELDDVAA